MEIKHLKNLIQNIPDGSNFEFIIDMTDESNTRFLLEIDLDGEKLDIQGLPFIEC